MKDLYKAPNYLDPFLLLEFVIDADHVSTYEAWTDLEMFQKWFCPTGFSIAKAEMDPKPGGYFRIHMQSPDGDVYPTKGEYILLDKPHRIVYKDSWDDDRQDNEPAIAEIILEPVGTKTNLKLYSSFASEVQKEKTLKQDVASGWKMFLNNLNNEIGRAT